MAEWLQPVPASIVFELLQYKIAEVKRGDVEHLEYRYCVTSYLHDLQSKKGPKRNVDYARMWGYSESWVSRNIATIKKEAMEQENFYASARPKQDSSKSEARPEQEKTPIPGDSEGSEQDRSKSEARPEQDRSKTYISEPLDHKTGEEESECSSHAHASETPSEIYKRVCQHSPGIWGGEQIDATVGTDPPRLGLWETVCQSWYDTPGWNHKQPLKVLDDFKKQVARYEHDNELARNGGEMGGPYRPGEIVVGSIRGDGNLPGGAAGRTLRRVPGGKAPGAGKKSGELSFRENLARGGYTEAEIDAILSGGPIFEDGPGSPQEAGRILPFRAASGSG